MNFERLIVLLLVCLCGCQKATISPGHSFTLRLANNVATPGMTETTLRATGESVFLASQDIVTGPDFKSVLKSIDEYGRPAIVFRVNEAAGKRMREIFSKNQGNMFAMVINGTPELAITIAEPFDNEFRLTGAYTTDEIDQTYSAITGHKLKRK